MNVLLKTKGNKGYLVVYEDRVAVEMNVLGVQNTNSMPYGRISGIEVHTTMAKIPLLCKGYSTVKVFGVGNQKLEIGMVLLDDAKKAEEIINSRLK